MYGLGQGAFGTCFCALLKKALVYGFKDGGANVSFYAQKQCLCGFLQFSFEICGWQVLGREGSAVQGVAYNQVAEHWLQGNGGVIRQEPQL